MEAQLYLLDMQNLKHPYVKYKNKRRWFSHIKQIMFELPFTIFYVLYVYMLINV